MRAMRSSPTASRMARATVVLPDPVPPATPRMQDLNFRTERSGSSSVAVSMMDIGWLRSDAEGGRLLDAEHLEIGRELPPVVDIVADHGEQRLPQREAQGEQRMVDLDGGELLRRDPRQPALGALLDRQPDLQALGEGR